uniref:Ig-like domain-containing protein n=1 Tax=Amphiprion ocellaris TaxID=80972 RepID=A0AAQ5YW59_AMPOC
MCTDVRVTSADGQAHVSRCAGYCLCLSVFLCPDDSTQCQTCSVLWNLPMMSFVFYQCVIPKFPFLLEMNVLLLHPHESNFFTVLSVFSLNNQFHMFTGSHTNILCWEMFNKMETHIDSVAVTTSTNSTVCVPVQPYVVLYSTALPSKRHPAVLVCSVYDVYPKQIKVSWFRDGQEVTSEVTSTDVMQDGDWYYQIHSHLEYTPRSGEKISCVVEHASLEEPLKTYWDPSMPKSDKEKIAIGASALILGLIFGLDVFWVPTNQGKMLVLVLVLFLVLVLILSVR